MTVQSTKQEREEAEAVIFSLLQKASLYLRAGDAAEADAIKRTIAHLQSLYNVTSGINRRAENEILY